MLRAEMAANHAAVVKELGRVSSEVDAIPRAASVSGLERSVSAVAQSVSELRGSLPAIIAAEIAKALRSS